MSCDVCSSPLDFVFEKDGYDVLRCPRCGLGSIHPLPAPATLATLYRDQYYASDAAWGYAGSYARLERGLKQTYRAFARRAGRRLGRPPRTVLDVGCAFGFFLDVARERWNPHELVGVDVTDEAEEAVSAKGYRFVRGFFEEVRLPEARFDLIFLGDSFEHFRDPTRAADALARLLAPGGVLLITTVDFDSFLARRTGPSWRLMTPPEHLFFWTRRSLARLFGDRGLESSAGRYWLYYPKDYVAQVFRRQFGFPPPLLGLWPGRLVPVPSLDVLLAVVRRPIGTCART